MKKKLFYLFLLLMSILSAVLAAGCFPRVSADSAEANLSTSPYLFSQQNEDVVFSIKDNKFFADTDEITLSFKNKSDTDYFYGTISYIESKSDGNWYSIPIKENVYWTMIGYQIPANSSTEQVFSIHTYYHDLQSGEYRIVKMISMTDDPRKSSYVFAEFTVE